MIESIKHKNVECYKLLTFLSSLESNDIMTTENNSMFGDIRFVLINNAPHAIANDVLRALDYKEGGWRTTIKRRCKHATKCNGLTINEVMVNLIPESDIFRLMAGSHLPSIKKHGFYGANDTVEMMLNNPDMAIKTLENYKKKKMKKKLYLEKK